MEFGRLTFHEIREAADQGWIVLVPTGCTEQQGPHLPVDFDTWFAYHLCLAASDRAAQEYSVPSLVLPALPFGPTPEHRNFGSGFIDLPQPLHEEVVRAVLRSLLDQGFTHIILWRGCGQHDLTRVIESLRVPQPGVAQVWQPPFPFENVWRRIGAPEVPGGHADSFTTSISLYLRPASVRKELIQNAKNLEPDWGDPNLDFAAYSRTGVIGDPTVASEELGARLWEELTAEVARMIREFSMRPL